MPVIKTGEGLIRGTEQEVSVVSDSSSPIGSEPDGSKKAQDVFEEKTRTENAQKIQQFVQFGMARRKARERLDALTKKLDKVVSGTPNDQLIKQQMSDHLQGKSAPLKGMEAEFNRMKSIPNEIALLNTTRKGLLAEGNRLYDKVSNLADIKASFMQILAKDPSKQGELDNLVKQQKLNQEQADDLLGQRRVLEFKYNSLEEEYKRALGVNLTQTKNKAIAGHILFAELHKIKPQIEETEKEIDALNKKHKQLNLDPLSHQIAALLKKDDPSSNEFVAKDPAKQAELDALLSQYNEIKAELEETFNKLENLKKTLSLQKEELIDPQQTRYLDLKSIPEVAWNEEEKKYVYSESPEDTDLRAKWLKTKLRSQQLGAGIWGIDSEHHIISGQQLNEGAYKTVHHGAEVVTSPAEMKLDPDVAVAIEKMLTSRYFGLPPFVKERFKNKPEVWKSLAVAGDFKHILRTKEGMRVGFEKKYRGDLFKLEDELDGLDIQHVFSYIAHGITAFHNVGLIIRDLKPENILIDNDNKAHLADLDMTIAAPENPNQLIEPNGTYGYIDALALAGKASKYQDIHAFAIMITECFHNLMLPANIITAAEKVKQANQELFQAIFPGKTIKDFKKQPKPTPEQIPTNKKIEYETACEAFMKLALAYQVPDKL